MLHTHRTTRPSSRIPRPSREPERHSPLSAPPTRPVRRSAGSATHPISKRRSVPPPHRTRPAHARPAPGAAQGPRQATAPFPSLALPDAREWGRDDDDDEAPLAPCVSALSDVRCADRRDPPDGRLVFPSHVRRAEEAFVMTCRARGARARHGMAWDGMGSGGEIFPPSGLRSWDCAVVVVGWALT